MSPESMLWKIAKSPEGPFAVLEEPPGVMDSVAVPMSTSVMLIEPRALIETLEYPGASRLKMFTSLDVPNAESNATPVCAAPLVVKEALTFEIVTCCKSVSMRFLYAFSIVTFSTWSIPPVEPG